MDIPTMFRDARFVPKSGNALWIETANARLLLPAIGDAGHSKAPRIVECPVRVGGLNRSPQHFILEGKDGVWDGTAIS
jgi:hypothetical protein